MRPTRLWQAYVDAGNVDALVHVDPDLLAEIWTHTDGSIDYLVNRGLETLRDRLVELEATWVPGSKPRPAERTPLPQAVDPVSSQDALRIVRALAARAFEQATRDAEVISGRPAAPLRAAATATQSGPTGLDPDAVREFLAGLARFR